jgi:thymidylate kinase
MLTAIEGLDGAGTTTLAKQMRRKLNENHDVTYTSEPAYYSPNHRASVHEKLFCFLYDRVKHCRHMKPAIESEIVLCDRFRDSTLAYQSHDYADEFGIKWRDAVHSLLLYHEPWCPEPDVTVYVDVPVETAMRRNDGTETREELAQAKEVYDYLYNSSELIDSDVVIVDGTQPIDDVVDEALWKTREHHSVYDR